MNSSKSLLVSAGVSSTYLDAVEAALGVPLSRIPEQAFSEVIWYARLHDPTVATTSFCCLNCHFENQLGVTLRPYCCNDNDKLLERVVWLLTLEPVHVKLNLEGDKTWKHLPVGQEAQMWSQAKKGYITIYKAIDDEDGARFARVMEMRIRGGGHHAHYR